MGYGQAPARPPIAGAINGASCRGASSGRWRRGPGRSPSWGPCPVPRRGRAYTGRGLRRQRPSPGFYGRAGSAGCHSGTSAVWATAATAPAKPHGLAVNTAGTSRWSGSVMVMRLGTSPPTASARPAGPSSWQRPKPASPARGRGAAAPAPQTPRGLVWGHTPGHRHRDRPRPRVPARRSPGCRARGVQPGWHASRRVVLHPGSAYGPTTDRGVLDAASVARHPRPAMPRLPEAGISQGLWPTPGLEIHALLMWVLSESRPALYGARCSKTLFPDELMARKSDRYMC